MILSGCTVSVWSYIQRFLSTNLKKPSMLSSVGLSVPVACRIILPRVASGSISIEAISHFLSMLHAATCPRSWDFPCPLIPAQTETSPGRKATLPCVLLHGRGSPLIETSPRSLALTLSFHSLGLPKNWLSCLPMNTNTTQTQNRNKLLPW